MNEKKPTKFERFAIGFGNTFGSARSFVFWVFVLLVWLALGPVMHFSDSWQLSANTPTTWIELFLAITTLYVGNRIERRQEQHEKRMLEVMWHMEKLTKRIDRTLGNDPEADDLDQLP